MSTFKDLEIIDLMRKCEYLTEDEEKGEVLNSEVEMFKKFAELVVKLKEKKDVGT